MPSIALFIKQLLSEDKYSADFSDRISERIKELNAAQLQGIYNHLQATAKTSKSAIWLSANKELMNKIEGVLKEQVAEAQKVDKILEESRLKTIQKRRKIKEAKIEQKRVMAMIAENARVTAEKAVREEEFKRLADEKVEITTKIYKGEERRDKWWKRTAVFFVIGVVVVCVVVSDLFILVGALFVVVVITAVLLYRAHQFTVVHPAPIDEEGIEMEIERRGDVLKKKAVSVLREKERKFDEQQARDDEDRKQRKAQKKAQLRFEAKLMAQHRQQQLANAQEILARRTATASSANGTNAGTNGSNSAANSRPVSSQNSNIDDNLRANGFMSSINSTGDFQSVMPTIIDLEGENEHDHDLQQLDHFDAPEKGYQSDDLSENKPAGSDTGDLNDSDYIDISEDEVLQGRARAKYDGVGLRQRDGEDVNHPEHIESEDEEAFVVNTRTSLRASPRGSPRSSATADKYYASAGNISAVSTSMRTPGASESLRAGVSSKKIVSAISNSAKVSLTNSTAQPKYVEVSLEDLEMGQVTSFT